MRLALFDIDGTLVTGPSTEKRFALHLGKRGRIGPRQALSFFAFLVRELPTHGRHVFKKNKAYLAGLREDDLGALAAEWVDSALAEVWFEPCIARLRRHQQAGDPVVLLSGTPQFVAAAIGNALGVTEIVAAECAARDGRLLAKAPLVHPFGAAKLAIAQALARAHGVSLAEVTAYADSGHDLALLRAVGTAVAVRPDEKLAAVAQAQGWDILGNVRRGLLSLPTLETPDRSGANS